MPIDTYLRIADPFGNPLFQTNEFLEIGPSAGLQYALACGDIGAMTVTLPPKYNALLAKDSRIGIWRSVNGRPAQLEGGSVFLIRKWDYGDNFTVVTAVHANDILNRRCVLWIPSSYGTESGPIDDMIKSVVTHNYGPLAASGPYPYRAFGFNYQADIISNGILSVAANLSACASSSKMCAWRNVLNVVQELCNDSSGRGLYLTAEIVAPTEGTLELRTYTGQRGVDRGASSGNAVVFSAANGNLENGLLTVDALNESNFALAGGPGRDDYNPTLGGFEVTALIGSTPINRHELFIDSQNASQTALTNESRAAAYGHQPGVRAKGDLIDTPTCTRGIHYDFGDIVVVTLGGQQYDLHLSYVHVTLQGQTERTQSQFELRI